MHDHHKLSNLAEVLKHLKGYMVVLVDGEELVVLRKDEFDELKEKRKEVQLELEETVDRADAPEYELEAANHELDMEQVDFDTDMDDMDINSGGDGQLGAGPRKKVRFEPLRGDLSPELQE